MPYHKQGAYDGFDSLAEVPEHYKRCRKRQFFILSDQGVSTDKPLCAVCGKPITIQGGNRGEYSPKHRKSIVMHYICSWEHTISLVYKYGDRLR